MILNKLRLLNFRNHKDFKADFSKTNVIIGPNASGKSNILEAIYLLSTAKSFKTRQNKDLISFGQNFSKIEGEIKEGDRDFNLQLFIFENRKEAKVDKKTSPLIFLLGKFLAVLFTPETLNLVLGSPSLRRRSMDLILLQVSKKYVQTLTEFLKILRQRNKLLLEIKEGRAKETELDFWDQEFLKTGNFLREEREKFLKTMNEFLPKGLCVLYLPSPQEDLLNALKKEKKREIEFGFTTIGPQKDDFVFLWNKRPLANFGSRGEIREGAIFFKLAEFSFIKEKMGLSPVLLFDDIFSELDKKRRENLMQTIFQSQTIMTALSLSSLNPEIIKKSKIIELR
jgi:DNA replication and repair protein RecF